MLLNCSGNGPSTMLKDNAEVARRKDITSSVCSRRYRLRARDAIVPGSPGAFALKIINWKLPISECSTLFRCNRVIIKNSHSYLYFPDLSSSSLTTVWLVKRCPSGSRQRNSLMCSHFSMVS